MPIVRLIYYFNPQCSFFFFFFFFFFVGNCSFINNFCSTEISAFFNYRDHNYIFSCNYVLFINNIDYLFYYCCYSPVFLLYTSFRLTGFARYFILFKIPLPILLHVLSFLYFLSLWFPSTCSIALLRLTVCDYSTNDCQLSFACLQEWTKIQIHNTEVFPDYATMFEKRQVLLDTESNFMLFIQSSSLPMLTYGNKAWIITKTNLEYKRKMWGV